MWIADASTSSCQRTEGSVFLMFSQTEGKDEREGLASVLLPAAKKGGITLLHWKSSSCCFQAQKDFWLLICIPKTCCGGPRRSWPVSLENRSARFQLIQEEKSNFCSQCSQPTHSVSPASGTRIRRHFFGITGYTSPLARDRLLWITRDSISLLRVWFLHSHWKARRSALIHKLPFHMYAEWILLNQVICPMELKNISQFNFKQTSMRKKLN